VVALARVAGRHGGVYDSHLRDESSYSIGLAAAVEEALTVGREGRLPVNIAHIKALGVDVHGQAPAIIASIEAAQRAGQRVTADQYPWSASGTSLAASLVPRWAHDGGRAAMLRRFDDPAVAQRLRADMAENLRRRGGAGTLLITEGPARGRRLAQVAAGGDPIEAAIALIRNDDTSVASFNQTEEDIEAFMRRPWVMTGSDASGGHPRAYGSFARKYALYVRERRVLSLRDFIHRSTALAADTFGLVDRGRLRAGAFADIVLFDPDDYAARSTYEEPTLLAAGVRTVLVNGALAVENGALTQAAAGRGLAHRSTGTCR
jgi:N-acyl-D-aspartate/D-glutamate deacylase